MLVIYCLEAALPQLPQGMVLVRTEYHYEYPSKLEHWSRTLCRAFFIGSSSIMVAFNCRTCYPFWPTGHQERSAECSCPKTLPGIRVNGLSGCGATPTQVLLYLMGPLAAAQWIPDHSASCCQLCRTTLVWRSSLDMLFRMTEQVADPELSYNGYVGLGAMQGLGARLAMFDRHG